MEEILASIRKIISDDSSSPASGAAARPDPIPEPEIANDDDDEETVSLEEVMFDEEAREEAFEELAELEVEDFVDDEIDEEDVVLDEEPAPVAEDASESFESLLSASRAAEYEPEPEPEPVAAAPAPVAFAPVEKAMPASPAYEQTTLTDDTTATAAAGALGKLISKMDIGSNNTLDGLVRELLRPMIKEWLDQNLASIVEEKVEAEVQRIARMAR